MNERLSRLTDTWRDDVAAAVAWLGERGCRGRIGLILGSGLGNVADGLEDAAAFPYGEIPGFVRTSVAEHKGRLVAGRAGGVPVVVLQGRLHPYEGLPPRILLHPAAVLAGLGVEAVVVTNAAGGLNRFYRPGDLMLVRDHVDLHLRDPLRGLLAPPPVTRAARATSPWDEQLARIVREAAAGAGIPLHEGVYASMWGPAYETRAEIGMLRRIGCDAVGMSTAPEASLLAALGVRLVGISCITNPSREVGQPELSHQDVVEVGQRVRERFTRLLEALLPAVAGVLDTGKES